MLLAGGGALICQWASQPWGDLLSEKLFSGVMITYPFLGRAIFRNRQKVLSVTQPTTFGNDIASLLVESLNSLKMIFKGLAENLYSCDLVHSSEQALSGREL